MKSYSEFIPAGAPVKLAIGGRLLYIQRSSGGAVLDITFHNGAGTQTVSAVGKGFKAGPVGGFDTITFKAAMDSTVEFIITDGDVNAQFDDASTIIGNDDGQSIPVRVPAGQRIPVDLANGTVNVNAVNVGINNTDAAPIPVRMPAGAFLPTKPYKAQAVTNVEPVNMAANAQAIVAADANRRGVRLRNVGANAVAIGGAGLIFSKAVVVIQPGETWAENEAAGAAWFGICDAGLTSILNIQVIA
jgi:hypothetical protein